MRSYSQDINFNPTEAVLSKPKLAHSDTSLDGQAKLKTVKPKTIKEQASFSVDDDVCSTDSSVIEEEVKKKKRKLFSGFSKKSKLKD